MKKLTRFFFTAVFILSNLIIFPTSVFAGANDFYFKDYIADYYLKKRSDNTSEMEVVETVTAVFPNYNQNHGIERYIPFLNQNDTNLTTESADHLNVEVTRNGVREPHTVSSYDDHFIVRIGRADTYVHGEQTYVIKYKFVNTITEFSASSYSTEPYQELYWDSNGTESSQTFESVTVNLHMTPEIKNSLLKSKQISKTADYRDKSLIHETNHTSEKLAAWCYVGRQYSSNQSRCEITDLADGIKFQTGKLSARENLTFVTNFKDKTFNVPENNFVLKEYVKSIEGEYYLTKDTDGVAKIKAKEKVVALFPTKNESSYFARTIPFVNESKVAFTTDSQEKMDVKISLDGKSIENPSITAKDTGVFNISVEPEDNYFHGEKTFTYEYELKNLVIAQNSSQQFVFSPFSHSYKDVENYSYKLHIDEELLKNIVEAKDEKNGGKAFDANCDDQSKSAASKNCKVEKTTDGYIFSLSDANYNRTPKMQINFKNGTFVIPELNRNYLIYQIFIILVLILGVAGYFVYRSTIKKAGENMRYLKSLPIVPEYTPASGFTVAELARNYMSNTKNLKVATLLELIVNKKISLIKGEKSGIFRTKTIWSIKVIDKNGLSKEQDDLIKIINRGNDYTVNQTIEIKHNSYSSSLESAYNNYDRHLKNSLEEKNCFKKKELAGKDKKAMLSSFLKTFGIFIIVYLFIRFGATAIIGFITWYVRTTNFTTFAIYEGEFLIPVMIIMLIVAFILWPVSSSISEKYRKRTKYGIEMSRYMDGLKLYIKMAEKERLEFLQSVENADTSKEGIVKLYERLLPYAAVFGVEKSWMKELENYYELENIEKPDWYNTGLNLTTFSAINSVMHSAVARPIDTSSSSGGGHSSGSSGGGGGGYSGGGGGGGGFGGW